MRRANDMAAAVKRTLSVVVLTPGGGAHQVASAVVPSGPGFVPRAVRR